MKNLILSTLFILTIAPIQSQLNFGINYNIPVYKPYTEETQAYLQFNNGVKSSTFTLFLNMNIVQKKNIYWNCGLSYKKINFLVENKVREYYERYVSNHETKYTLVKQNLDLLSTSYSLGIQNEFAISIKQSQKLNNFLGIQSEIYFFEYFKSNYVYAGTKRIYDNIDASISPLVSALPRNYFLSAANIALFFRNRWQKSDNFSLATKISLGTNLYSDWDQFKKYAWLGVGLELGFGNKPLFKQKEK